MSAYFLIEDSHVDLKTIFTAIRDNGFSERTIN